MKTKLFFRAIAACLCACLAAGMLAACTQGEDGGETQPAEYTITAQSGTDYTVSAPDKAKEGDTVTVTVTATGDTYITGVTYNGSACAEEDGTYTFTMPAEDVTIAVQTGTYTAVEKDGWAELGGDSSSFTVRGYFQSARLNLSGTGAMFDVEAGGNAAITGDVLINNGGMILVGGSMDVNGTVASDSSVTIEFTDSSALLDVAEFDLEEVNLNGLWGEGNLIISSMTEDAIRAIRWFHDGEELICGRTYFLADNPGGGYVFSSVPEPAEIAAIMAAFVLISAVWRRMGK